MANENSPNVTPLHDRVIVKPAAAEEKTAGFPVSSFRIHLQKKNHSVGIVVAAGPGLKKTSRLHL